MDWRQQESAESGGLPSSILAKKNRENQRVSQGFHRKKMSTTTGVH